MASKPFIEEFLYRGKPDGSAGTFHLVLGAEVKNPFGGDPQLQLEGPMTPERAEELGFTLSAILEGINDASLKSADASRLEAERIGKEITDLKDTHREETAALENTIKTLQEQLTVVRSDRDAQTRQAERDAQMRQRETEV